MEGILRGQNPKAWPPFLGDTSRWSRQTKATTGPRGSTTQAEERTTKALRLLELLDRVPEGDAAKLEELRPELERTNAIVARPWNDWELGLSLGKWGLFRKWHFAVNQALVAVLSELRTMLGRRHPSRPIPKGESPLSGGHE